MMVKDFTPVRGSTGPLLSRIRSTKGRIMRLRNPNFMNVDGKPAILGVSSGHKLYGTVRVNSRRDTENIARTHTVALSIGWDRNRNEVIQAAFE